MKTSQGLDEENICDWQNCEDLAKYPAPKSRNNSKDRYHFCLHHVRLYNESWDFFQGMTEEQITDFQISSVVGHRQTYKNNMHSPDNVREKVFEEFGFSKAKPKTSKVKSKNIISSKEEKYIKILNLDLPFSFDDVKKNYKKLAKKHHPDLKGDIKKFQVIGKAYNYFKEKFKNSDYDRLKA